jgi:Transglycosylase SLT domain
MALGARVWLLAVGLLVVAGAASSEMLVMEAPDGRMLLTNRGARSGYRVISRHREFSGSSAMGLHAPVGGDPAKYEETVKKTAKRYSLEPSLVKAVIRAESNFDSMAISSKGAMGLMQLMPDTARMHEVRNAFDPTENIHGGVRHLRYLMNRYAGKLDLVLAAYNAGTKPVDECRGIPRFPETQECVRRVRMFQGIYRQGDAKASLAAPVVARADLPAERSKGPAECRPPCRTSDRGLLD